MIRLAKRLLAIVFLLLLATNTRADSGHPVAIRWWGQAMISIETYWDLTVVIDPYGENIGYANPQVSGDLVLITHEHGDHNNAGLVTGEPIVARGIAAAGSVQKIDHVLDRLPGEDKPTWRNAKLRIARSPHAIRVLTVPSWHDRSEGKERGANAMFIVEVDGVRIVHCGDLGQLKLTDEQLAALGSVDVLLISVSGVSTVDGPQAADLVRQVKPRIVVPIHYKTPNLVYDLQELQGFLQALDDDREVVRATGNTFAVSAANHDQAKLQAVVLEFTPWEMPKELAGLFKAKEAACHASQLVFAKLSPEQMNFKPSNGTHTPRWNIEHMMGRELGFFTQIYAKLAPSIAHINLNPKQMPPDYEAAHPNWSGAEEARQMERVSALTRRFAYLLDGMPLDEKAPGSRWTPRRLLKQMERHYGEHTANVQKKFELPDWPKSEN